MARIGFVGLRLSQSGRVWPSLAWCGPCVNLVRPICFFFRVCLFCHLLLNILVPTGLVCGAQCCGRREILWVELFFKVNKYCHTDLAMFNNIIEYCKKKQSGPSFGLVWFRTDWSEFVWIPMEWFRVVQFDPDWPTIGQDWSARDFFWVDFVTLTKVTWSSAFRCSPDWLSTIPRESDNVVFWEVESKWGSKQFAYTQFVTSVPVQNVNRKKLSSALVWHLFSYYFCIFGQYFGSSWANAAQLNPACFTDLVEQCMSKLVVTPRSLARIRQDFSKLTSPNVRKQFIKNSSWSLFPEVYINFVFVSSNLTWWHVEYGKQSMSLAMSQSIVWSAFSIWLHVKIWSSMMSSLMMTWFTTFKLFDKDKKILIYSWNQNLDIVIDIFFKSS